MPTAIKTQRTHLNPAPVSHSCVMIIELLVLCCGETVFTKFVMFLNHSIIFSVQKKGESYLTSFSTSSEIFSFLHLCISE
jgi:hypothetical protein